MKKKRFSIALLVSMILAMAFFSGCGEKVTADSLLKAAQENAKNVSSYKGSMVMDMEIGMEAEEEEPVNMTMNMSANMEMIQDPMIYHADLSINMDSLGIAMEMDTYGELKDNQMISYVNVFGEWQKTTAEANMEESMNQMLELDAFIMDGKELTLAENTEKFNDKEVYVVSTIFTGEEFKDIFAKMMETMGDEMGDIGSLEEMGMEVDYENVEMSMTYKIYKDSKLPAEVSLASTENNKFEMSMEGTKMSFDKLSCVLSYNEFDTLESIEIPEEAKNAEEVTDDFAAEGGYEQDENGNYLLNDYEDNGSISIAPIDGYVISEYSDTYNVVYSLEKTLGENHTCEITYYLTKLGDDWTLKDVETSYKGNKEFYIEDYGYYDAKFSDVQSLKVGNRDVKYVTSTYNMGENIQYKECNAWFELEGGFVVECWLYETDYNEDTTAITEKTVRQAIEAVK